MPEPQKINYEGWQRRFSKRMCNNEERDCRLRSNGKCLCRFLKNHYGKDRSKHECIDCSEEWA